jgi:hypothetical protein
MNEAEPRAEHIDLALAAAGWGVVGDRKAGQYRKPGQVPYRQIELFRGSRQQSQQPRPRPEAIQQPKGQDAGQIL